jgi:hypothetical protein
MIYSHRLIVSAYRAARRTAIAIAVLVLFLIAAELARAFFLLRRIHPAIALLYAAAVAILAAYAGYKLLTYRADALVLRARPKPRWDDRHRKEARRYARYVAAVAKRLGHNRLLPRETAVALRQHAYDLSALASSRRDVLKLAERCQRVTEGYIAPALEQLTPRAEETASARIAILMEDMRLGTGAAGSPLLLAHHSILMSASIAEVFVYKPSLWEYWLVLGDVAKAAVNGRFLRWGNLFFQRAEGVGTSFGPLTVELRRIFSWLCFMKLIQLTAMKRCTQMRPWDFSLTLQDLDASAIDMLEVTDRLFCDCLKQGLPGLIRESAPRGDETESAGADTVLADTLRAMTLALQDFRSKPTSFLSLLEPHSQNEEAPEDEGPPARHRRHRSRSDPRVDDSVSRVFETFTQRIKYSVGHLLSRKTNGQDDT